MNRASPQGHTLAWMLLLALACGHEVPVSPGTGGPSGPFQPGAPIRLTFADGYESTPAWLPDGSGILHSFDRVLNGQFDRCLGVLPAGGGSRTLEFCGATVGSPDSLDALEGAGVGPGGRLLYQWSQSFGTRVSPNWSQLVLASLDRPWNETRITLVPYTLPGGRVHARVSRVDWLDDERAVYLGEDVVYPRACSSCIPDTVRIGREGVVVDLGGAAPSLSIIPGTADATSLAGAPGSGSLYLTRPGDTRVYRISVAGGAAHVVHDFGSLGVARDAALGAGVLYVIVGGRVYQQTDPAIGSWQTDFGGRLFRIDLESGGVAEVPPGGGLLLRRPAVSPTGSPDRIVVEGYELTLNPDSVIATIPDLWLYEVP